MELTQLRYFLTTANCGQIVRAAELLHVSQSAVSMAIARLERELNVDLFERKGRSIQLTQTGELFLKMITAPLAELDFAQEAIKKANVVEPNAIALSVEMPDFATHFEQSYHQLHPNVIFKQTMDTAENARQKLACAMVDFCLSFEPFHEPDITCIELLNEPVYIQLSPDSPFYHRDRLSLSELSGCSFVSFGSDYSFRRWMDRMCYLAGFQPKICFEVCDTQSLLHIISLYGAVTFIAQSAVDAISSIQLFRMEFDASIRNVLLTDNFCRRSIYLSYHKNRILSEEARAFLDFSLQVKTAYEQERTVISALNRAVSQNKITLSGL